MLVLSPGTDSGGIKLHFAASVLLILVSLAGFTLAHAALPVQAAEPPVIVLVEPALIPPYNNNTCESYWLPYPNGLESGQAYLTLNVASVEGLYNSAVWRPSIAEPGFYRVDAYIPARETLVWSCSNPNKIIDMDTASARYTINHAEGQSSVTRSQKDNPGAWVDLGSYLFSSGTAGTVQLTDVTGETSFQFGVAFSAVRFTWVSAPPPPPTPGPAAQHSVYLPIAGYDMGSRVVLLRTFSADELGRSRAAFIPEEVVSLRGAGSSTFSDPTPALVDFRVSGPCGFNQVFSQLTELPPGPWSVQHDLQLPDCRGAYTFELKITSPRLVSTTTHVIVVNLPSEVVITTQPAFDKCNVASLSQLTTWMAESPFKVTNLYIGGISRACSNTSLTPLLVSAASQQGWIFIPTWVGPQAPCSAYRNKFNINPGISYMQGRAEADAAYLAALGLGLGNGSVIYYNMEAYNNTDTVCRAAVQSFLSGWTVRLHELTLASGAYGLTGNMNYWWYVDGMSAPPDNVWPAYWLSGVDGYNPSITVWGIPNLADSKWPSSQRIYQYAGNKTITYGGVAMAIDINAAQGRVASIPQAALVSTAADYGPPQEGEPAPEFALPASLDGMQILEDGQGWVISRGRMLWSSDLGQTWSDLSPSPHLKIISAHFPAADRGWLLTQFAETGKLSLLRRSAGAWLPAQLPLSEEAAFQGLRSAWFEDLDGQTAWLSLRLQTSSNFSLGELYQTRDGGETWQRMDLPIGAPVRFLDSHRGWSAGGAAGDELYRTRDGGASWQPLALPGLDAARLAFDQVFTGLPQFLDEHNALLPVTLAGEFYSRVDLYTSQDGGETWNFSTSVSLEPGLYPDAAFQLTRASESLLLFTPGGPALPVHPEASPESLVALAAPQLPRGVIDLSLTPSGLGWAISGSGECARPAYQCTYRHALWQTQDHGLSWVEVTP
jgi:photosystem II stability/assembly factor-like uncharacterized protein